MLKKKTKEPPRQSNSDAIAQPIPDPWSNPSTAKEANPIPETWHLPIEPYPLISPAGNPEAPRLVSHQSTSEEILLQDELKLKTSAGSRIKQQVEGALTLLYWLETIGQPNPNWQMSSP
ncbi:MAG: hypothetical protein QNJ32_25765 [Xenococcaceae cyanobacterium MO_167.B27]|nr:hypothetical protein [Xenococcaceae cyanobacterium MO_167.B27]